MHLALISLVPLFASPIASQNAPQVASPTEIRENERLSSRATVVVRAPVGDVWSAFTTGPGIVRTWGVARANVDLRIGGSIEVHVAEKSDSSEGSAVEPAHERRATYPILCFEPARMLSMRAAVEDDAPEWLRDFAAQTWTVVTMAPLSAERTQVSIATTSVGFGDSLYAAFDVFESANAALLDSVRRGFATDAEAARTERAWTLVREWIGGDWISEQTRENGDVARSRVRMTPILNGAFVLEESWTGDQRGMALVAHTIYGVSPETGAVSFWSFEHGGAIARGTVRLEGEQLLVLDWNLARRDGTSGALECVFELLDKDRHVLHVFDTATARQLGSKPTFDMVFQRVGRLPAGFEAQPKETK